MRLHGPVDVLAAVPFLVGFAPEDSLVLLSLRGSRHRVGLTLRADLPAPSGAALLAAHCARHLVRDGASAVLAVTYGPAEEALVGTLRQALQGCDLPLLEALRVREGRWWSWLCGDPTCCPPEGTPILRPGEPGGPSRVGAHLVAAGLHVLPDRAALAQILAPPDHDAAARMESAVAAVLAATAEATGQAGPAELRRRWRREVDKALRRQLRHPPPALTDAEVAELLVALLDVGVRDFAARWSRSGSQPGRRGAGAAEPAAMGLWVELARRAPPEFAVAPATLLAHTAWLAGDGALARVAVRRALGIDPTYRLAQLLERILDGGLSPPQERPHHPPS